LANGASRQMQGSLISRVRSSRTLSDAWTAVRRNGRVSKSERTREEIAAFESDALVNLRRIQGQLQNGRFTFQKAIGKRILKKNKKSFRPLVISPVASRIVQRAIHEVLADLPTLQLYVRTLYSFGGVRKEKGTDRLSAVPAAIHSVLEAIGSGATFIVRSDISDFFTKIPKPAVTEIVSRAAKDKQFIELFSQAIKVELENMAALRHHATKFPIEDIGVAQGNSLSTLLGNLYLHDFDTEMNKSLDVRCLRYIDDFLILAPSKSLAENTFSKALGLLSKLGLDVSAAKTQRGNATAGFEFLGINLQNGLIRPCKNKRDEHVNSIRETLSVSSNGFNAYTQKGIIEKHLGFIPTMTKVKGMTQGWIKSYWFCNDGACLASMNSQIDALIKTYVKSYANAYRASNENGWELMGLETLKIVEDRKFEWQSR